MANPVPTRRAWTSAPTTPAGTAAGADPPRTTSIRFDAQEYLDRTPLPDVTVVAQLVLILTRKVDVIDVPDDGPNGRKTNVVRAPVAAARCETKRVRSTADGLATLTWNPSTDVMFASQWNQMLTDHPDLRPLIYFDVGFTLDPAVSPALFRVRDPLTNGGDRRQPLLVDLAATIVGHVTDTTARLWFSPAPPARAGSLTASYELFERGRPARRVLPRQLTFVSTPPSAAGGPGTTAPAGGDRFVHAVADLSRLRAATDYDYHCVFTDGKSRWIGGRGSFRTADPAGRQVRIAFASCSRPRDVADLDRWAAMTRWTPDVTVLLGDQIYGDGIDANGDKLSSNAAIDWQGFYDGAYRSQWRHRAVREALRRNATYMMHDDHDIDDDWGTAFTTIDVAVQARVRAGQQALEAYQHSHNPSMPHRRTTDDAYDYAFTWGPVAAYVLDERMRRGIEASHPVLGVDQWNRLVRWTRSTEAQAADVIVVVSPVPLAFCDVDRVERVIRAWNTAVDVVGGLGAPLFAVTEAAFGWSISDSRIDTEYINGKLVEPDLRDQWSYRDNRAELAMLLDLLFDLQNDPNHQRVVIVLSGDTHVSMVHTIRSNRKQDVGLNDTIYQITSSPIGVQPVSTVETGLDLDSSLFGTFGLVPASGPATSPLDALRARFVGGLEGSWSRRSFGSLAVTRRPGPSPIYEVCASLHFDGWRPRGGDDEARLDLVCDLAHPGRPNSAWSRPSIIW